MKKAVVLALILVVSPIAGVVAVGGPTSSVQQETPEEPDVRDVSDVVSVDLPAGKEMEFTIHELNVSETDGTVIEYSESTQDDTVVSVNVTGIDSENVSHYRVYRGSELVDIVEYNPQVNISRAEAREKEIQALFWIPGVDATLFSQDESQQLKRDLTPAARFTDNKIEIWTYAESDRPRDYGTLSVQAVSQEDSLSCDGVQIETNEDGQIVSVSNETEFSQCSELGDFENITVTNANYTLNGSDLEINQNLSDIGYGDLDDLQTVTEIRFEQDVAVGTTYDSQENITYTETRTVQFEGQMTVSELESRNVSFAELEEAYVGGRVRAVGTKNEKSQYPWVRQLTVLDEEGSVVAQRPTSEVVSTRRSQQIDDPDFVEVRDMRVLEVETVKLRDPIDYEQPELNFSRRETSYEESQTFDGSLDINSTIPPNESFDVDSSITYVGDSNETTESINLSLLRRDDDDRLASESRTFDGSGTQITFRANDPTVDGSYQMQTESGAYLAVLTHETPDGTKTIASAPVLVSDTEIDTNSSFDLSQDFSGDLNISAQIDPSSSFDADLETTYSGTDQRTETLNLSFYDGVSGDLVASNTSTFSSGETSTVGFVGNDETRSDSDSIDVSEGGYIAAVTYQEDGQTQIIDRQPTLISDNDPTQTEPSSDNFSGTLTDAPSVVNTSESWNATANVTYQGPDTSSTTDLRLALINSSTNEVLETRTAESFSSGETRSFTFADNTYDVQGAYRLTVLEDEGDGPEVVTDSLLSVIESPDEIDDGDSTTFRSTRSFDGSIDSAPDFVEPSESFSVDASLTNIDSESSTTDVRIGLVSTDETTSLLDVAGESFSSGETRSYSFSGDPDIDNGTYSLVLLEREDFSDNPDVDTEYRIVDRRLFSVGERRDQTEETRFINGSLPYLESDQFDGTVGISDTIGPTEFASWTSTVENVGNESATANVSVELYQISANETYRVGSAAPQTLSSGETSSYDFGTEDWPSEGFYIAVLVHEDNGTKYGIDKQSVFVGQTGEFGPPQKREFDIDITTLDGSDDPRSVDVTVRELSGQVLAETTTDSSGSARVSGETFSEDLVFRAEGSEFVPQVEIISTSSDSVEIVLQERTTRLRTDPTNLTLSGTVENPDGERVSDVDVTVADSSGNVVRSVRTDSNGSYETTVETKSRDLVVGTNESLYFDDFVLVDVPSSDTTTEVDPLVIRPYQTTGDLDEIGFDATGRVVDQSDDPVGGVEIVGLAADGSEVANGTTDSDGSFGISGETFSDVVHFRVRSDNYTSGLESAPTTEQMDVGRIQVYGFGGNTSATEPTVNVTGVVEDQTSERIPEATVSILASDGSELARLETDAAGRYQTTLQNVDSASIVAEASSPQYLTASDFETTKSDVSFDPIVLTELSGVVRPTPTEFDASGRLVNTSGTAISGSDVTVYESDGTEILNTTTDGDGRFSVSGETFSDTLTFVFRDGHQTVSRTVITGETVKIGEVTAREYNDDRLESPIDVEISGTLQDESGETLSGEIVDIRASDGTVLDSEATDEDGTFETTITTDSAYLVAQTDPDGYFVASDTRDTSESVGFSLVARNYSEVDRDPTPAPLPSPREFQTQVSIFEQLNVTYSDDVTTRRENIFDVVVDEEINPVRAEITNTTVLNQSGDNVTFSRTVTVYSNESGTLVPYEVEHTETLEKNRTETVSEVESEVIAIVDVRYLWTDEDGNVYETLRGSDGEIISPVTNIEETVVEEIDVPEADIPDSVQSIQWEVCEADMARPTKSTNSFFVSAGIQVILEPNHVTVSDRTSEEEISNSTYRYPAGGSLNVSTGGGQIQIFSDRVFVPGCAFVIDRGDGVSLPSIVGNETFEQLGNTFYLGVPTVVEPLGFIGEYLAPITDDTPVSGVSISPLTGDLVATIESIDRSQSTQFGGEVSSFTLRDGGADTEITFRNLDEGRSYTLYEDGEEMETSESDDEGTVTFSKSAESWDDDHSYTLVTGQQTGEAALPGAGGGGLPGFSLSTPALILIVILGIIGSAIGYLYFFREGEEGDIEWV